MQAGRQAHKMDHRQHRQAGATCLSSEMIITCVLPEQPGQLGWVAHKLQAHLLAAALVGAALRLHAEDG